MQIDFTEDQEQFREVVSRFMRDKSQPSTVRALMQTESGYDAGVWKQLSSEVGLTGTHFPESYGGFGFGPIELGVALEEMGRSLYCGPFFASAVMAGGALLIAASEDAKEALIPDIAAGSRIAALVLDDLDSPANVGKRIGAQNNYLTGTAELVVDAQNADVFVVVASEEDALGLYSLPADAPGISVSPVEALDATRKLAKVSFDQAPANRIGDVSPEALDAIWDYICVALAHEMIGGAQQLLESTVDYTKIRYQFGRPIGSFQGLKHRCADLLVEVEFAKAATHHAAMCLEAGQGEPYVGSMVKAMAAETYVSAAKEAVQMRGGIGFTWEEDTHLWYKRAKASEVFMGTPGFHRERMVSIIEKNESLV